MSEAAHEIVFRDAHSMAIVKTVPVSCDGVNHADFSPDGHYFIASCEFSGEMLKVRPISLFDWPRATSSRIDRSRGVRAGPPLGTGTSR